MPKSQLTVGELKETHLLYRKYETEWRFLNAAYEGTRELIRLGYLCRHERESWPNYVKRMKEAYGFNYTRSIVDIFNFYLFKEVVKRGMGPLKEDESWIMFMEDCNLFGDDFDDYLTAQSLFASILGYMGLLVDKASKNFQTKKEEKDAKVYPYVASYTPLAVLDWEYKRDEVNRPYLAYLKLLDDDGQFRIWYQDSFEVWEAPLTKEEEVNGRSLDLSTGGLSQFKADDTAKAVLVKEGPNPIEEIPFVWLYNLRTREIPIGRSDVNEVARIDVSILRNLSQGEEIVDYAAFPMMRKPKQEGNPDGTLPPQGEDEVGPTAILEFDPEQPESKPDWLKSEVSQPLTALSAWIVQKIQEIYRSTNTGGMAATEISTTAKSGAAIKAEFQLLNSNLVRKAINLENAEKQTIYYWLKWDGREDLHKEISIERERSYDVENLADDLENALTAKTIVQSKTFSKELQKNVVRQMLPGFEDDQLAIIDKEIEDAPEPAPAAVVPPGVGDGSTAPPGSEGPTSSDEGGDDET